MNNYHLLDTTAKKIKECVKKVEDDWGWHDNLIYNGCIKAMSEIALNNISEQNVQDIIHCFLFNWGNMGRSLGGNKKWDEIKKQLPDAIKKISLELERNRGKKLEDCDIDKDESEKCYKTIFGILKSILKSTTKKNQPTATTKILHLMCPDFFPPWDTNIRTGINKEVEKKYKVNNKPSGYSNFMFIVKDFLKRYATPISELSAHYKRSQLKIVDEFMWSIANNKFPDK